MRTGDASRALEWAAKEASVLLGGKRYLVDQRAFMAHLRYDALVNTAWISGIVVLFDRIDFAQEKEKKEDKSLFSMTILPWCASFGRAVSYVTVSRVLEAWCVENMPLRTADKLIKNISKSALRKVARYNDKSIAAQLMMVTTARASLVPHLAVFLVEQFCLIAQNPDISTFTKKTVKNAHRCILAIIGASIGAAIGTLIDPGRGTVFGATVGEDWIVRDNLCNTIFYHNERLQDMFTKSSFV